MPITVGSEPVGAISQAAFGVGQAKGAIERNKELERLYPVLRGQDLHTQTALQALIARDQDQQDRFQQQLQLQQNRFGQQGAIWDKRIQGATDHLQLGDQLRQQGWQQRFDAKDQRRLAGINQALGELGVQEGQPYDPATAKPTGAYAHLSPDQLWVAYKRLTEDAMGIAPKYQAPDPMDPQAQFERGHIVQNIDGRDVHMMANGKGGFTTINPPKDPQAEAASREHIAQMSNDTKERIAQQKAQQSQVWAMAKAIQDSHKDANGNKMPLDKALRELERIRPGSMAILEADEGAVGQQRGGILDAMGLGGLQGIFGGGGQPPTPPQAGPPPQMGGGGMSVPDQGMGGGTPTPDMGGGMDMGSPDMGGPPAPMPDQTPPTAPIPQPKSRVEFNALPKGAHYLAPDGKEYVK